MKGCLCLDASTTRCCLQFTWNKSSRSHYHTQRPLSHFIYGPPCICLPLFTLPCIQPQCSNFRGMYPRAHRLPCIKHSGLQRMQLLIYASTHPFTHKHTYIINISQIYYSCALNYTLSKSLYLQIHVIKIFFQIFFIISCVFYVFDIFTC